MTKDRGRLLLTGALWAVCLSPTWAAILLTPETFWQGLALASAQVVWGLVAFFVTSLAHDL